MRSPPSAGQHCGGAAISSNVEKVKHAGEAVVHNRIVRMFGKNTVASTIAFALDLAILWCLVELLAFPRVPAAVVAFLIPMVVFYVLERQWVFAGTKRGVVAGFVFFAVNVGIGFAVMLAVYWSLLLLTDLHYLVARVAASVVNGIVMFVLNGVFNFKKL